MSYRFPMGTTVWIDDGTRQELRRLQDAFGDPSVNATIRRLIAQPAMDARAIFARHRDTIRAVLRRRHLGSLVAFGSRARGDAAPASDLDLAAVPGPKAGPLDVLAAEADLSEALGLRVHLVDLPNPKVEAAIRKEGVRFDAGG